jgi:hypothetical protein
MTETQGLVHITKRHFWKFFVQAFTQAFTEQNIRSGWEATGLYPFSPQRVLVRILKRKESKIQNQQSSPSMPGSVRALRRTYGRLHAEGHVDNKAAIHVRAGEKLASENKILRMENEGLRGAIFEEKRKIKLGKALNFYEEGEQAGEALFFSPAKVTRHENVRPRWKRQNFNDNVRRQIKNCSRRLHEKKRHERQ